MGSGLSLSHSLTADQAGALLFEPAPQLLASVTITKAPQNLADITAPASVVYAVAPDNTFVVSTSASGPAGISTNAMTFSSLTPMICSVAALGTTPTATTATVTILAAGTCTIAADLAGSGNYLAAATDTADIDITKGTQAITGFNPTVSRAFAIAPNNTLSLSATGGSSGNPVTFASSTPAVCTTSGTNNAVVTFVSIGTCALTADQAGSDNLTAALTVFANITVTTGTQTITSFTPASPMLYAPAPNNTFALSATGGDSGNPVVFASSTPTVCTTGGTTIGANNSVVTLLTTGTCTLTADQAGSDNFAPAATVTASVTINPATQTITGFTPPTTVSQAAGSTLTLSATGGASANPVTFASTTLSICTTGGSNGQTLTILAEGVCALTANQAGNTNYSAAPQVTASITINVPAQLYFIHADHLGTPRTITKATDNTKVWEWRNEDAFGNNAPDENPSGANVQPFKYNLRFPGQYFDQETGTYYNYFRDYDPSIGRYVQSDPIGLRGGINTYGYGDASPLTRIDAKGLSTYMCTAPLHALTKTFGDGFSKFAHDYIPLAHHLFLCVIDKDGKKTCEGQDQQGRNWYDLIRGPGKRSKDDFDENTCKKEEPDDKDIEHCVLRKFSGPRPTYGIPFGTDCQEWAKQVLNECRSEAKRQRDIRRQAG